MIESVDTTQAPPVPQPDQLPSDPIDPIPAKKHWLGKIIIGLLVLIVLGGILYERIYGNKNTAIESKQITSQLEISSPSITIFPTITETPTSTPVHEVKLNDTICDDSRSAVTSLVKKFEEYQMQKNISGVKSLLAPLTDKTAPGDKAEFTSLFNSTESGRVLYSGKDTTIILKKYQIITKENEEFKEWGMQIENDGSCFVEVSESIDYFSNSQKIAMNRKVGFTIITVSGDWKIDSYIAVGSPVIGKFSAF